MENWHTLIMRFQSTPPAEAQGRLSFHLVIPLRVVFQSTPPAEARGDRMG